jgi:F-type H+-transporting ATPase subunit delta
VDVSDSSISSGIAERYATAVFELVKENNNLPRLEENLNDLTAALDDSADLRELLVNPVYSREEQERAITALAQAMKLIPAMKNVLGLMAQKRRLAIVPALVAQLKDMLAEHKGEMTAEVTSAVFMTDEQMNNLSSTLSNQFGKNVRINVTVDQSLIGGLIVKVGSKMIDTSIRSKLNSLQNAMKEVG